MLAWLSGSAELQEMPDMTNKDLNTSRDEPDTPVPVFAMRAFKQAIFGTPQLKTPAPPSMSAQAADRIPSKDDKQAERGRTVGRERLATEVQPKQDQSDRVARSPSPTKPLGILVTPGTINGRRKQVKFGQQVLDNADKRSKYSNSGLPDDCPGKFPSPFTPKTIQSSRTRQSVATAVKNRHAAAVESSFKEVLDVSAQPAEQKVIANEAARSKDDSDLAGEVTLPQSASGRYWKAQYDQYSSNSVAETKRLIAKHKLAKDYARLKDDEATALRTQLEYERKKRARREGSLELQIKQLRERLRDALADNAKLTAEVSAMRLQLEKHSDTQYNPTEPQPAEHVLSKEVPDAPKSATVNQSIDVWLDQDESNTKVKARRLRRSPKNEQLKSAEPGAASTTQVEASGIKAKRSPLRPSQRDINKSQKAMPLSPRSPNITPRRPTAIDKILDDAVDPKNQNAKTASIDAVVIVKTTDNKPARPTKSPGSARAKTKVVFIEGQRLDEAKARVAERRRMKKNSRTNVRD